MAKDKLSKLSDFSSFIDARVRVSARFYSDRKSVV